MCVAPSPASDPAGFFSSLPPMRTCARRWLGYPGLVVDYESDNIIAWVECDRCRQKRERLEAEEAERRWREEERTRPRECALEGCSNTFTPGTDWQAYCCDQHRWRAHRAPR